MTRYVVTAFCERCSTPHPTGIELESPRYLSPTKSVAELFEGIDLPPEIATMSRYYFQCLKTGEPYKQLDNEKLFLAKTK